MKFSKRRLLWILPLFLLLVFVLLTVLAGSWLESSGGRQLLQKALSNSLGVPVRLAGDYELRLLPRIRFTGTRLLLEHSQDESPFASSDEFSAVIELLPFIRKEIRVTSIRLQDGHADLYRWSGSPGNESATGDSGLELPRVALVLLENFSVKLDAAGNEIHLDQLQLQDFRAGEMASLDLRASLRSGEDKRGRVQLKSQVLIDPDGWSMELDIEDMELAVGDTTVKAVQGFIKWNQARQQVDMEINWPVGSQQAHVSARGSTGELPAGILTIDFPHPPPTPASRLQADLAFANGFLEIEPLELLIAGQEISGKGCVLMADSPSVNLLLESPQLNLGELYQLLPESEEGASELPLELSVHLKVGKAHYAGAEAIDLDVLVGEAPDCTKPVQQDPLRTGEPK